VTVRVVGPVEVSTLKATVKTAEVEVVKSKSTK